MAEQENDFTPEVQPFSAADVLEGRIGDAPPSYEEVIGQYETSIKSDQSAPALGYIDIMPRLLREGDLRNGLPPTFQNFDEIMTAANMWLTANPTYQVWTCETVERKVNKGGQKCSTTVHVDLQSMYQYESTFGTNCYVFGLRLWLCQRYPGQTNIQQLGLINALPSTVEIDMYTHPAFMFLGRMPMHYTLPLFGGMTAQGRLITFKGLKKNIEEMNKKFKEKPIPGTVLTIESTSLKFSEGFVAQSLEEVANAGSWCEREGLSCKRFTQILRIFYVKGPNTSPEIKMQEFKPPMTSAPKLVPMRPAKFGDFDGVMEDARYWMNKQAGIRIVNVETRDTKLDNFMGGYFSTEVFIDTDRTDSFQIGIMDERRIRFLRLFYVEDPTSPSLAQSYLTSKLFTPVCVKGRLFETMAQTMDRVDAWVKAVGLPILSVETFIYPKKGPTVDEKRSDYMIKTFQSKEWINTIRVYFNSQFEEPDPSLLPSTISQKKNSSSCQIL